MRVALFDEVMARLATRDRPPHGTPPHGTPLLALLPAAADRRDARVGTRGAACALAAAWSGQPHADYLRPDRVPQIVAGDARFHVSLAYGNHASGNGCALIALAPVTGHGIAAIGVDLCPIALPDDWDDVARLYLPPASHAAVTAAPLPERAGTFASVWSALEACNKAAHTDLCEWHPSLTAIHDTITTFSLVLPSDYARGWRATLALRPA
ncbi:hypothetical protein [Jeongeupia chitinilytica]|uniref:4'-phosphopantetheinyl transferase domain-containing protein n=1 Tax=Jeongeupia chitinilytica TaxID=1041641 RepID=A0ABQ3GVD2_9NEIS|nr:hypothetical protein [Jeongeupia chitinilytica]GHD56891.1 hypothetical protein GCM10007350_04750 [Jeongeupia chitinilytica]